MSITDHICCRYQILEKKLEYNDAVHQLFIDFKKPWDSVSRKVLCNILTELGIPKKLVQLIKICQNETYSAAWVGQHLSDITIAFQLCSTVCH